MSSLIISLIKFEEIVNGDTAIHYQLDLHELPEQAIWWYSIMTHIKTINEATKTINQKRDVLEVSQLYDNPSDCWEEGNEKYNMIVEEARGRITSKQGVH